jgi:hypothetical protein
VYLHEMDKFMELVFYQFKQLMGAATSWFLSLR